jgi:hypothetical protein
MFVCLFQNISLSSHRPSQEPYVRDVFIPTSEPSGTIRCEVSRESMAK